MWGIKNERKTVTSTKDYAVGFPGVDLNIPKQSWNFFASPPGHTNCIMDSLKELTERRFFAVCWVFNNFVASQDMVSNHMQKKPLNISAGRLY